LNRLDESTKSIDEPVSDMLATSNAKPQCAINTASQYADSRWTDTHSADICTEAQGQTATDTLLESKGR